MSCFLFFNNTELKQNLAVTGLSLGLLLCQQVLLDLIPGVIKIWFPYFGDPMSLLPYNIRDPIPTFLKVVLI